MLLKSVEVIVCWITWAFEGSALTEPSWSCFRCRHLHCYVGESPTFQDKIIGFSKVVCIFAKGTSVFSGERLQLFSEITKQKQNQCSFGYKNDVGLETKDSSLWVMKCKKMVDMNKNWINNYVYRLFRALENCFSLAFTSSAIFMFLEKDFRSAKTLAYFIINRHSLPKNDERRNQRYFNWKNLLSLVGMPYKVNFLILFAQLQCSFGVVRLQILSSSSWT